MKISVIICAYTLERWDALSAAVASCDAQTLSPHEVIVVIDYNEELRERSMGTFTGATVIANSRSKGLSGARNTGVAVASGDVIVFLDDDAFAEERWLEELTTPFSDPLVAGTGGWIVPHWEGSKPHWFPRTFYWVFGCSYDGLPPSGSTIRNPIGASMALRREVFDEVGGFTSGIGRVGKIPLGCEETELCIRYTQHRPGERIVLTHEAVVHHRVPPERCTWHYFWTRCWAEGLSKAAVASLVGAGDGLAAERRHVAAALPREVLSSLRHFSSGPGAALSRVVLLGVGTVVAAAGYVWGGSVLKRHPLSPVEVPAVGGSVVAVTNSSLRSAPERSTVMVRQDIDGPFEDVVVDEVHSPLVWVEVWNTSQVIGRGFLPSAHGTLSATVLKEFATSFVSPTPDEAVDIGDGRWPHITVVIPSILRDPPDIARRVGELLTSSYPTFDVIVVDNRSAGDESWWEEFRVDPRLRLVSETTPGISAARNRGISVAHGDIIAFTDDDVIVDPGWLQALAKGFARHQVVDLVCGAVLPTELRTPAQSWFEGYFGGFNDGFTPAVMSSREHGDDALFPYAVSRFGAGCNMAFRREALATIGGFNEELGTGTLARGGEDLRAALDIIDAGGTVAFEPTALVRHTHRATREAFLRQTFDYGVGLSAMLTSLIVDDPRHLVAMVVRVPAGLRRLLGPHEDVGVSSSKPDYPRITLGYQLVGLVCGPWLYARSRWQRHRGAS